ncbi:MAG TPA: STAS domain-containing protein [Trebonia sp.]|nr:STAS domain-containing protein [Trebonia sp.]
MTAISFSESAGQSADGQDARELPLLRVLLCAAGGDAVLRLAGEIDMTTVGVVTEAMERCLADTPARMTIDLGAVTFCDCAGARTLRRAVRRAAASGVSVRLTAPTAPVRRILSLIAADELLGAIEAARGAEAAMETPAGGGTAAGGGAAAVRELPGPGSGPVPRTWPGVLPVPPPAPPPDAVSAARGELNQRYASGVERLLWELEKVHMPDAEAIRRAIVAAAHDESDGIGPALVLLQAARLGLDRVEALATEVAHTVGLTDEALAAVLGLPSACAAATWREWLATRRTLPYDEPAHPRRPASGDATAAAVRAGHCARQAAARTAQIAPRLERLRSAASGEPSADRQQARSAAESAGEARISAAEAAERATLGLLRAADALEQSAASYQRLADADDARAGDHRKAAAWCWHTAQEYRELARDLAERVVDT